MPENPPQPEWEMQPDGSRVGLPNGIRIVGRSAIPQQALDEASRIEHLVTWKDDEGAVVIIGLDAACRAVYSTVLYGSTGKSQDSSGD